MLPAKKQAEKKVNKTIKIIFIVARTLHADRSYRSTIFKCSQCVSWTYTHKKSYINNNNKNTNKLHTTEKESVRQKRAVCTNESSITYQKKKPTNQLFIWVSFGIWSGRRRRRRWRNQQGSGGGLHVNVIWRKFCGIICYDNMQFSRSKIQICYTHTAYC